MTYLSGCKSCLLHLSRPSVHQNLPDKHRGLRCRSRRRSCLTWSQKLGTCKPNLLSTHLSVILIIPCLSPAFFLRYNRHRHIHQNICRSTTLPQLSPPDHCGVLTIVASVCSWQTHWSYVFWVLDLIMNKLIKSHLKYILTSLLSFIKAMSLLKVFFTKSGRMNTLSMVCVSWAGSVCRRSWSPRINLIRLSLILTEIRSHCFFLFTDLTPWHSERQWWWTCWWWLIHHSKVCLQTESQQPMDKHLGMFYFRWLSDHLLQVARILPIFANLIVTEVYV